MGCNIKYLLAIYGYICHYHTPRYRKIGAVFERFVCVACTTKKLKLNSSKTELLQISPLNNPPVDLSLTVNGNIIKCSDNVKDLWVLLEFKLTMVNNIQSVTRKAYCALANKGKIRRDLTKSAAETLVNACYFSHGLCKKHQLGCPTSAHKQPTETTEHGSSYYLSLWST